MVPEGGRLRRRSPACTSGAAAEARERRLRSGGSGAEAPLALRGFGRRSTAGAAGGLGRRSTACPAEGGSGAGAPLALRGGSGAGIPLVLRRDGSGREPRLRSGGMTQARSPACAPRAVAGRMKLACAPGAGAQEPRSCSGNCSAVAARSRQPRRERLPMSAWSALRPTRAQRGPASAAPEAAASSHPAQGVRLVTRTRPTPPHPHPHPAPTRRTPTAAPAPAPPSSAVPGSGGRGLRR